MSIEHKLNGILLKVDAIILTKKLFEVKCSLNMSLILKMREKLEFSNINGGHVLFINWCPVMLIKYMLSTGRCRRCNNPDNSLVGTRWLGMIWYYISTWMLFSGVKISHLVYSNFGYYLWCGKNLNGGKV